MGATDIIILVIAIIAAIAAGLYFLNRWAAKKSVDNQTAISKNKQTVSIYVIDKKRDLAKNANMPKIVMDNLPKVYRFMKMYLVKAKIGPQIMTLVCDKKVYNKIHVKKNFKVDIAGIQIVDVKGVRTDAEIKEANKQKKLAEKKEKAANKKKTK